jgi:hypothetical protein
VQKPNVETPTALQSYSMMTQHSCLVCCSLYVPVKTCPRIFLADMYGDNYYKLKLVLAKQDLDKLLVTIK